MLEGATMTEALKKWVRSRLSRLGIIVRRVQPYRPPAIVFDDPLEALVYRRGGKAAAFRCPVDRCVAFNGFSFGGNGWHPFVAALQEFRQRPTSGYHGSILERYYSAWQPANAAEALIGCDPVELPVLTNLPSYAYLAPWLSCTPDEFILEQQQSIEEENLRAGGIRLSIAAGYNHHGPTSPAKGGIEYERLVRLYRAMAVEGFDRRWGEVEVTLLKRGNDHRFLVTHGHHRAAAASALGESHVPATFAQPHAVDLDEAPYWPQVRRGIWPREVAAGYLHHLFTFDSLAWACEKGLSTTRPDLSAV